VAYKIYTLDQRPELRRQVSNVHSEVWHRFMNHDEIANRVWDYLFEAWPQFQLAFCDENDTVIAAGNMMPLVWDGNPDTLPDGWDAAAVQAMNDHDAGRTPNALNAYAIAVAREHQRKGLSAEVLKGMTEVGKRQRMHSLVACVRPTLKDRYPLTSIERYAAWKQPDGSPFDPWMRVHWRAGAEQLWAAPLAMVITGTVTEWEEWTGMRFPETGPYIVPGALQPVAIDVENDLGRYEDPNVWMWHRL
jgi:hypothetical protein